MKKLNRGFTLIELLVVIAIIGILSTIVLASLSTARTKGEDAAIQSTLQGMKTQAELYYSNSSNYGTLAAATTLTACSAANTIFSSVSGTGTLTTMIAGVKQRTTAGALNCSPGTAATGAISAWAVEAPLKAGGFFCVDSVGNSTTTAATSITLADAVCG